MHAGRLFLEPKTKIRLGYVHQYTESRLSLRTILPIDGMAEARVHVAVGTNGDGAGAPSKAAEEEATHQHVIMEGQHAEQEVSGSHGPLRANTQPTCRLHLLVERRPARSATSSLGARASPVFTGRPSHLQASGLLRFHVVRNDDEAQSLVTLIEVKNIYTKQLPKMGAEYIVRLVMNREHKSLVCRHADKVVCRPSWLGLPVWSGRTGHGATLTPR